jgi:hypothetical protein
MYGSMVLGTSLTAGGAALAFTGFNSLLWLLIATALIMGGLLALAASRHRHLSSSVTSVKR